MYLIGFVCFQSKNDMSKAKDVYNGIMDRFHDYDNIKRDAISNLENCCKVNGRPCDEDDKDCKSDPDETEKAMILLK